jgi:ATP-dependent DNA ligase
MARSGAESAGFPLPLDLAPMEARLVDELAEEPGWQFEPKWDGFRCLAFRAGDEVDLRAKSGKPLTRYFPEMSAVLRGLPPSRFVLDGELAIPVGETFSFDALQMRLHPAESRIKKLAAETPAVLFLFDLLATPAGESLLQTPLLQRRAALEAFFRSIGSKEAVRLSPFTRDLAEAQRWLEASGGALDGVIAKRLDGFISRASAQCSRSRNGARRIAWSAGSATSGTRASSGRCCSASTIAKATSITSGLLRHCTISTARR